MKNPLNKRLTKELFQDFGKYLVIFIFMAGLISLVSGFLVADGSMIKSYNDSFEKYNIEDGNFEVNNVLNSNNAIYKVFKDDNTTIYQNFYIEEPTKEVDSTLRVFINREEVNRVCLMSGEIPTNKSEIAIDRMYADNNKLSVGDTITLGDVEYTITGLVALSDYSALFSNNSDMMFDSIKFGVAIVTKDGFNCLDKSNLHYNYSWKYNDPSDDAEKDYNDLLKDLYLDDNIDMDEDIISITPQYSNQAIHFTGDDMGGDRIMFIVLLYIVIVIIGFVFAVTTNNTILKESSIIGTLRASGYSKMEILTHYITMPLIVTIVSAIVGNILGYTVFKQFFADLYYGSYSLPTYVTIWNAEAFVLTTIIPFIIMMVINVWIISKKLELSPLKFLRHDLDTTSKKKSIRLSTKMVFFSRFRLRVIFQNMPNYITLFVGILFANFILLFGLMFPPLLSVYQDSICDSMFSDYQYILKDEVETNNKDAEKCSVNSLNVYGSAIDDSVSIYGIVKDSKYIDLSLNDDDVYVSSAYAEKYDIKVNDIITLKAPYGKARYGFTVTGIYEYPSTLAVFMSIPKFNQSFNCEDDYFNGYFSNSKITDIDQKDISSIITVDDLTKVSRQLQRSMGDMTSILSGFGMIMFALLIYLLSKLIIEKNTNSISMTKILGYSNIEISKLYIMSTTLVTVISMLLSIPLCDLTMRLIFKNYVAKALSGWMPYYVPNITFVKMFLMGMVCYILVAVTQLIKIKKIPMDKALRNVE